MIITTEYRASERSWLWLAKIASGVVIFALLMVHLVVNHLVASGGLLTYADVLAYYANPLIPLMEGLFLLFVISHALLGLRGIILDLAPAPRLLRAADTLLTLAGVGAFGYGLWLLLVMAGRAAG